MLEHFGYKDAADTMMRAIEMALEKGEKDLVTPDMGGKGSCKAMGGHIASLIESI